MTIYYISNVRIPTPRAHGYAIMKMCSEIAKLNTSLTLCVPSRRNNESNNDPFDFYQIRNRFNIKYIPSLDLINNINIFQKIVYWVDVVSFYLALRFIVSIKKDDVIYTRDYLAPFFLSHSNSVLELHDLPKNKFFIKRSLKKVKKIIVLNSYLKDEVTKMGFDKEEIYIIPSGIDVEEFVINESKTNLRQELGLPEDRKIIMYSGQFYAWKGVDVLAQTAKLDSQNLYVFIGGTDPELSEFNKKYGDISNIKVIPFVERKYIPKYLAGSDILILPNSGKETISAKYTSPLKLYEYMAAERPVVAADLPSIHEAVSEDYVFFAKPDDPESFVKVINEVINDDLNASKKVKAAFDFVTTLTWDKRVRRILNNITNV